MESKVSLFRLLYILSRVVYLFLQQCTPGIHVVQFLSICMSLAMILSLSKAGITVSLADGGLFGLPECFDGLINLIRRLVPLNLIRLDHNLGLDNMFHFSIGLVLKASTSLQVFFISNWVWLLMSNLLLLYVHGCLCLVALHIAWGLGISFAGVDGLLVRETAFEVKGGDVSTLSYLSRGLHSRLLAVVLLLSICCVLLPLVRFNMSKLANPHFWGWRSGATNPWSTWWISVVACCSSVEYVVGI